MVPLQRNALFGCLAYHLSHGSHDIGKHLLMAYAVPVNCSTMQVARLFLLLLILGSRNRCLEQASTSEKYPALTSGVYLTGAGIL